MTLRRSDADEDEHRAGPEQAEDDEVCQRIAAALPQASERAEPVEPADGVTEEATVRGQAGWERRLVPAAVIVAVASASGAVEGMGWLPHGEVDAEEDYPGQDCRRDGRQSDEGSLSHGSHG